MAVLCVDGILLDVDFLHHVRRRHVTGLAANAHRSPIHLQIVSEILAAAHALLVRPPTVVRHVLRSVIVFLHRRI